MRNFAKWTLILIGAGIGLMIAASILLYFFLPINKIKDYAAKRLSEQIHHEVTIKSASFNLFSGIKLKGVTIANAPGFSKDHMVSADVLELKYAFLPLLQRKIVIPEINFVRPRISVEKNQNGEFNFSDIFAEPKTKKIKPYKRANPANPGAIDLLVNNFKISDGELVYIDHFTGKSGLKNVNVSISNITLFALKPIEIKAAAAGSYLGKTIPLSFATNIGIDISGDKGEIKNSVLSIAGDTLAFSGELKGLKTNPNISLSLSSNKIELDHLLAIFAAGAPDPGSKKKSPQGALTKSLKKSFSWIPSNLTVSANFDLKNVTLKTLKLDRLAFSANLKHRTLNMDIKDFSAYKGKLFAKGITFDLPNLSYSLGKLELHGFSSTPFLNDMIDSFLPTMIDMKNNIEGALNISMSLKGAGIEMPDAFTNLKASGVILLSKGRIHRIKSFASIGEQYGVNMLKHDMAVSGLRVNASVANKIMRIEKLQLQDTDVQVNFSGDLDFNKMEYRKGNRLNLKFNPAIAQNLPKEFSLFKDEKGLLSVDFEMQGSLFKPFPSPLFQKPLEAIVGKFKVKINAKKVEIETKAQQAIDEQKKKLEEDKKRLEEEAKKKVKEIFKF
ncbi:AsmA family protein [Candidatus Saganbacteria bacterium]|nr:AsmA family protein [Candidatus Saganbacteria bacterium]